MSTKVAVSGVLAASVAVALGAIAYAWGTPRSASAQRSVAADTPDAESMAPSLPAPRAQPPALRLASPRVFGAERADAETESEFKLRQAIAPELEAWVRDEHVTKDQLAAFYAIQRDMYAQARLIERAATKGQIRDELSDDEAHELMSLAELEKEFDRRLAEVLTPAQIDDLLVRVRSYYMLTVLRLSE